MGEDYRPIPYRPFTSFEGFYPFYLGEHSNKTCRRLHVVGTTGVLAMAAYSLMTLSPRLLLACPLVGYGCAWVGHYVFEKNRPATFKHPFWSLRGDFQMWSEVVTGKRPF